MSGAAFVNSHITPVGKWEKNKKRNYFDVKVLFPFQLTLWYYHWLQCCKVLHFIPVCEHACKVLVFIEMILQLDIDKSQIIAGIFYFCKLHDGQWWPKWNWKIKCTKYTFFKQNIHERIDQNTKMCWPLSILWLKNSCIELLLFYSTLLASFLLR